MTLDLRREAARAPLHIAVPAMSSRDLDAARTNWRERMVSEHASARVFGVLLGQTMRAGLAAAETHRVADMARQELDHAVLCARVLAALGAEPVADLPRLDPIPDHEDASPIAALLRNVISIGCCSETVAVALVASEREHAGPPELRVVLDSILRDEVKHARLGWRLVTRFAPALTLRDKAALDEYLVDVLTHQIDFHAPFLTMGTAGPAGLAIGAPDGPSNYAIFVSVMTEIVVPGLDRAGLDASAAWREAQASRAAA